MENSDKSKNNEIPGSRNIRAGGDISGYAFAGDIEGGVTIDSSKNKSTTISSISIDNNYLTKMPSEYAESLKNFSETVNKELQRENVENPDAISELQENTNKVAEELVDVKPAEVKYSKKTGIRAKLAKMAESLVKMSPKIARTVINFTPLAPLSGLIGESFENMVNAIMNEQASG